MGRKRILTGEMPPRSELIRAVQDCCDGESEGFDGLRGLAEQVMRDPPPDTSGFPRWWVTHPRDWLAANHIIDRLGAGSPFDLSEWILRMSKQELVKQTVRSVS